MIRPLLIPGLDGSPAPHWQHWRASTDPSAKIVEQHSWSSPSQEAWLPEIAAATMIHAGAVLVGHSLGAIAIERLLAYWPQIRVGGALLVAPAAPSRGPRTRRSGPIRDVTFSVPTIVAASCNGPWMDQDRARELSESWGADFIDTGDGGHISLLSTAPQ